MTVVTAKAAGIDMRKTGLRKAGDIISRRLASVEAGSFLFYAAFLFFSLGQMIGNNSGLDNAGYSTLKSLFSGLKYLAVALLVFKVALFQRYSPKQMAIVALICLFCFLSYRVTKSLVISYIGLFVIAGKGVDMRTIAALALFSSLITICFCLIGYAAGLLPDLVYVRATTGEIRHTYGFAHPNSFGLTVTETCISLLVLREGKVGLSEIALCFIGILAISLVSDTRTAMVGVATALTLSLIFTRVKSATSKRHLSLLLIALVILIVALSLFLMISYDPSRALDSFLNDLVSDRPRRSHWYYTYYSPGILGQDVSLLPSLDYSRAGDDAAFNVDNSYALLFLRFGPIALIAVAGCLLALLSQMHKRRIWGATFIGLVSVAVYGFAESFFTAIQFNYFLIAVSWLIYGFPDASQGFERNKNLCRY